MKAIDKYIEKIDGFESMSFSERRAAARKAKMDDNQHTKATLKSIFRAKPAKDAVSVYGYKNSYRKWIDCYTLAQCESMKEPSSKPRSEAQKAASAALAKRARENSAEYRAILLCRELIENDVVVIDTETTDLYGVAIQIAAVCCKTRDVLYSSLIHTDEEISEGAFSVHGIDKQMLADAPKPAQVARELEVILKDKTLVAFNAEFDARICRDTFKDAKFNQQDWICAMYSAAVPVCGAINRYGTISLSNATADLGVKWSGAAHDAIADCLATVDLIHAIASLKR